MSCCCACTILFKLKCTHICKCNFSHLIIYTNSIFQSTKTYFQMNDTRNYFSFLLTLARSWSLTAHKNNIKMGSLCLQKLHYSSIQVHHGIPEAPGKVLLHHYTVAIISHENQWLTFRDDLISKVKYLFHCRHPKLMASTLQGLIINCFNRTVIVIVLMLPATDVKGINFQTGSRHAWQRFAKPLKFIYEFPGKILWE